MCSPKSDTLLSPTSPRRLVCFSSIDVRQGELSDDEVQHLSDSITVEVETKSKEKVLVVGSVFGEDLRCCCERECVGGLYGVRS